MPVSSAPISREYPERIAASRRLGSSSSPSGLAQAFEHMRVVFRPHPRHATADTTPARGRCDGRGLFQRFLCLFDPAELAELSGEPAGLAQVASPAARRRPDR